MLVLTRTPNPDEIWPYDYYSLRNPLTYSLVLVLVNSKYPLELSVFVLKAVLRRIYTGAMKQVAVEKQVEISDRNTMQFILTIVYY